ncbi:hypothetical protein EDL79_04935 [Ehrlichia ruminantium]|uniref:Uncharacterized protein n=1 Tax=Ehrlichia ruminantium TaxID=779 RepID=A0AAE6UIT6_EHRRU|nr:hypothetical protein [Ehrlichia ruminantium]QGR02942.1 hypothetical protein EDL81_04920 [Ehrlichia ruminantium]QGR03867.1 hypothetical protein EDL80_04920 [Ehrlichia ruminantium]QGR04793.1 hypothetical protein EDL79_04935 [Ehrlichia ruminantium]
MTYNISLLVEENDIFNVYRGEMHLNSPGSNYYMSGSVTNQLTGNVGELDFKYNNVTIDDYYVKCDLNIVLRFYDSNEKGYQSTFFNRNFKVSSVDGDTVVLVDDHCPLLQDTKKIKSDTGRNCLVMFVHSNEKP